MNGRRTDSGGRRDCIKKEPRTAARLLATGALAFTLSFAVACQTTVPETPVNIPSAETPQDEALTKSVRARLLSVKTLDLSRVKVVSSAGTVYLSGTVTSLDARQQAIKLAWTVSGVQSVVNVLEVEK